MGVNIITRQITPAQNSSEQALESDRSTGTIGTTIRMLGTIETMAYTAVAILLTGAMAHSILSVLGAAGGALLQGESPPFFQILDQILIILMLVEIMHTVRVSLGTDSLNIEPFLLVGLIASIRRILVITLEQSSHALKEDPAVFNMLLVELGVIAGVILVLMIGIWLLRACVCRQPNIGRLRSSNPEQPRG